MSERPEDQRQPNTVLGVIAHVDAGKTTLSEALLYVSGAIRKRGRVDDGDTVMDTDAIERSRGITVFSGTAPFLYGGRAFTLLDTPGHVDFSAETERAMGIMDACVLVISGASGVQAHTRTLFRLLALYEIPTVVFVTKMDYALSDEDAVMDSLRKELDGTFVKFGDGNADFYEETATCSEETLDRFLETGTVEDGEIRSLVRRRLLYPVFFGSGLKLTGVEAFLSGLVRFLPYPEYGADFSARAYKIMRDAAGERVTFLKVTGGTLRARDAVTVRGVTEKVHEIRRYSGSRYTAVQEARAGDLCGVTGLTAVRAGDRPGDPFPAQEAVLKPVMRYAVSLPEHVDPEEAFPVFKALEEEDPALSVTWNGYLREIEVGIMGEVQGEVLCAVIRERTGMEIRLTGGHVLYMETIDGSAYGVGHFEPLRHYAEVHVRLDALPRGSGLRFRSDVPQNDLAANWQNLILTHLKEKEHAGVLTGSPVTDLQITVTAGRAHLKHTEGGDFRQATYRAVRNALMHARSVLLEPYVRFRIRVPQESVSRAMNDIRARYGTYLAPVYNGGDAYLSGRGPVTGFNDYPKELASYTGGTGQMVLEQDGYDRCHDTEAVLLKTGYDPLMDLSNPASSVFCAYGAGFNVPWDEVERYMHLPRVNLNSRASFRAAPAPAGPSASVSLRATDDELEAIMLREFGPIRRPQYTDRKPVAVSGKPYRPAAAVTEELVVDGYNVIFAWEDLRKLSEEDIAAAREKLIGILVNYSAFRGIRTTVVFDGYRVFRNPGETISRGGVTIVYTKEQESGDLYIEKYIGSLPKDTRASVVTSDGMIQIAALRKNAVRIASAEFADMVREADREIAGILETRAREGHGTVGEWMAGRADSPAEGS
ncbi:MAG: TetM/TetW/TetO/TetS family tetracycline resistance ribosomal protection protein [Lachnospiraceae bacterium]|nr:TetM/TetW/TetO/TetS family tetracycline resistance ribosomal protection protein [Lachnospiraceae bacterium]